MQRLGLSILAAAMAVMLPAGQPGAETRLLIFDQARCEWCETWDAEVGAVYDLTDEGKRAPLMRAGIHDPLPEGILLSRKARYTPTFVLLKDGAEVGRIEGYPGEDFFYGMLQQLLKSAAARPET